MSRLEITVKNFDARMKSIVKRGCEVTTDLQDMIDFAGDYYLSTPDKNALYLTKALNGAIATKGLNATKCRSYILARFPHLEYKKNKAGDSIFQTKGKHAKHAPKHNETIKGTLWAEYKSQGDATTPDLDKAMLKLLKVQAEAGKSKEQLIQAFAEALKKVEFETEIEAKADEEAPAESNVTPIAAA